MHEFYLLIDGVKARLGIDQSSPILNIVGAVLCTVIGVLLVKIVPLVSCVLMFFAYLMLTTMNKGLRKTIQSRDLLILNEHLPTHWMLRTTNNIATIRNEKNKIVTISKGRPPEQQHVDIVWEDTFASADRKEFHIFNQFNKDSYLKKLTKKALNTGKPKTSPQKEYKGDVHGLIEVINQFFNEQG